MENKIPAPSEILGWNEGDAEDKNYAYFLCADGNVMNFLFQVVCTKKQVEEKHGK